MTNFLVDYKKTPFLYTSRTKPYLERLNWRCEILLTENKDLIKDKKVLDLASHDGRFSHACLELGARHVTGIEGRQYLVDMSNKSFAQIGHSTDKYNFICGDIFDSIKYFKPGSFDIILCFGIFYHTIRNNELLDLIKKLLPKKCIIDTLVFKENFIIKSTRIIFNLLNLINKKLAVIKQRMTDKRDSIIYHHFEREYLIFLRENHNVEGHTIEKHEIVALPTINLLELLFQIYNLSYKRIIWSDRKVKDWSTIEDYKTGRRVSYLLSINKSV